MIPSKQTNFLYFSDLLSTTTKYTKLWNQLKKILEEENIDYGLLKDTNDIWCNDYMPIQKGDKKFIQFTFDPDYLHTPESEQTKSSPQKVTKSLNIGNIELSDLIIEGGNLVHFEKNIAFCDKIFKENSFIKDREVLIAQLQKHLDVKEMLILPSCKDDHFSQASTTVKFLNDNTLLVVNDKNENKNWTKSLDKVLQESGMHLIDFPGYYRKRKNKLQPTSAVGCYINFIFVNKTIILPQFNIAEDTIVISEMKKLYPFCKIVPIDFSEMAEDGGLLSSLAWGIKK